MQSPLWAALYPLQADPVRARISLNCGTGLKVPLTVEAYLEPPRGSDKTKKKIHLIMEINSPMNVGLKFELIY